MKHLISAGLVIFFKRKDKIEYLILHYPHGHWDFVKGKIEKGESKEEAAARELKEETGLKAKIIPGFEKEISYIFTDYDGKRAQKTVFFMLGKTNKKEITLSFEHVDHAWLPYNQAMKQLTYDNAKQVLKKAHQFIQAM